MYNCIKAFVSIQTSSKNLEISTSLNVYGILLGIVNDITLNSLIPLTYINVTMIRMDIVSILTFTEVLEVV